MRAVIYAEIFERPAARGVDRRPVGGVPAICQGAGLDGGGQLYGCGAERRQPVPAGVPEADGRCGPASVRGGDLRGGRPAGAAAGGHGGSAGHAGVPQGAPVHAVAG